MAQRARWDLRAYLFFAFVFHNAGTMGLGPWWCRVLLATCAFILLVLFFRGWQRIPRSS